MRAREAMTRNVRVAWPDSAVQEVARMDRNVQRGPVISRNEHLLGFLSLDGMAVRQGSRLGPAHSQGEDIGARGSQVMSGSPPMTSVPSFGVHSPRPEAEVTIAPLDLRGTLIRPAPGQGLILFAHGSGSSRLSPRNRQVASQLQQAGFGTLLFDLLLDGEAADRRNVFDIPLLAERLVLATEWVRSQNELADAPLGYFGASTGAAAALAAEALTSHRVGAIVSRGGRPDLAGPALPQVRAATLLIVGGEDHGVIELNEAAAAKLTCTKELAIIPGAGHLFEEPGALDMVTALAQGWFMAHLRSGGAS